MEKTLNNQLVTIKTDPELQEFVDLDGAIKFIVDYITTLRDDNLPFIDKSVLYKDYLNSLNNLNVHVKALNKASFSFLFKVFCVHYGYRTVLVNARGRKKMVYLKPFKV